MEQLAPIAKQIRLIAVEAKESSLDLEAKLVTMAAAFESLEFEKL